MAKAAGVGIGTVSRVLNGGLHVKEETRLRVFAAIASLDYQPNQAARRLSSGKTYSIGIVTPFFTRPLFLNACKESSRPCANRITTWCFIVPPPPITIKTACIPSSRSNGWTG
ncbi:MAG UNVERIFIED_CONTAM: LacI family transcriptional regulator [Anaerolineae bacterium]